MQGIAAKVDEELKKLTTTLQERQSNLGKSFSSLCSLSSLSSLSLLSA